VKVAGAFLVTLGVMLSAVPAGGATVRHPSAVWSTTCYTEGIVVAQIYAQWVSHPLPQSGACWTTERPVGDTTDYVLCNTLKQKQTGNGIFWVYDDTNPARTPSDGTIDYNDCHDHDAYYAEWMSRLNGYTWDFSPQYVIEEDYTSASHTNLSYEGTRAKGSWGHTNSSFANIPGLDAAGGNIASSITADCHKVVIYSGTPTEYMIGLYNDTDPSANEAAIVSALNSCYGG
jgi:hypothetical protein